MEATAIAEKRREQIIEASLELYVEKGIERTTVKDITDAAGITRSLFYHYFASRDEVTQAILDRYVQSFDEAVRTWDESREEGDVVGSLASCVALLRRQLFDDDAFRLLLLKDENASLYLRFVQHTSESIAHFLTETTAADYARHHAVEISHLYESFYVLVFGLIGYLRQNPEAPDELIADLIVDTLHLEMASPE